MAPNYDKTREKGVDILLRGLSTLPTSEKFADLQVTLGDRTWKVHKDIVCCRSDFFAKACEEGFKEEREGIVELHDEDPDVIDKMFHYIYRNEYDDADTELGQVLLNVRMVAVAEKYFIDHLAHFATSKLNHHAANAWKTIDFADAIDEAYTTTADSDRVLRDTILDVVMEHAHDLFDAEQNECAQFQAMAARTPSFMSEVAARQAAALAPYHRSELYRCPNWHCPVVFRSPIKKSQWFSWRCPQCACNSLSGDYEWSQKFRLVLQPGVEKVD